jgi:hypothetical protein
MGHDSTAYNSGMVHIAGSHFTMHGSHKGDVKEMAKASKAKQKK